MNSITLSWVLSLVCLLMLVILTFWFLLSLLHQREREQKEMLTTLQTLMVGLSSHQHQVLMKTVSLLSVKDPLAYQSIQAMEPTSSTSNDPILSFNDPDEALRYAKEHGLIMFDPHDPDGVDNAFTADEYERQYAAGADGSPTYP